MESDEIPNSRPGGLHESGVSTEKMARVLGGVEGRLEFTWHQLSDRVHRLSREMQERTRRLKNENPLRAIVLIAATAFVAGVVLRIWRSQKNG